MKKLLYNIGGIVSLVFLGLGLVKLWPVALADTGLATCIWMFTSGVALSLGLFAFQLRDRIAALEKRGQEAK